ncbi:metallophosphoesterase [Providencia huaxiensis]|uniref:metallophosphoesterase n=1 Tax=Providencia huaxiensis TaxID=2027290 RepID=UPI0024AA7FD3|nr:metallophosphoesterase [Providencia rettgeri]MBZ3684019.1 metallophosphoesterase [Providencia rettgeri]
MSEERNGIYLRIDGDQYRHIWVVGDIHGCFDLLNDKLQEIDFDKEKDLLISVGDLIDRGDQNVECLDLINEKWFRAVRGNHEQMAIDVLFNGVPSHNWLYNGGDWFFMQDYDNEVLSRACLAKAEQLPLIIEVIADGKKTVIAHADYPSDEYEFGKLVDEQYVIWSRERISNNNAREIKGADLFLFGHTPMPKGAVKRANQEYIDTGAVFGYGLTLRKIK